MKRKALYIIMIIAILLGIIVVKLKDFNYSTLYGEHKRLEIVMGSNFNIKDVQTIANQTINKKSIARTTTLFKTSVAIDAKDFTDTELNTLFSKLNEKYSKEFSIKELKKDDILKEMNVESVADMTDEEVANLISQIKEKYNLEYTKEELTATSSSVRITSIPKVSVYDMLKGCIVPGLISLAIVAVYFAIKYHKLYKKAWILAPLKLIFELILNQAFILSVVALARIPVSMYLPALLIFIWLLQIVSETVKNEKLLMELKEEK